MMHIKAYKSMNVGLKKSTCMGEPVVQTAWSYDL